jgi:hypothetical protein
MNDTTLQTNVKNELRWEPSIHGEQIGVPPRMVWWNSTVTSQAAMKSGALNARRCGSLASKV